MYNNFIMEKIKGNENIALSINGFYKKYSNSKTFSVENLSFEVKKGEFHGFIGANGAGKTTTIKSIIGAYAKFQGKVLIYGHKHSTIEGKKRIGYIPEVANFPKELNSFQYLKHMSILSGIKSSYAKIFANQKLKEMGLEEFKYRNPNKLSSGQKKKLLLAQALINEPDLLIMDEPAANLDPKARSDFFKTLKNLQKMGKAILISSHILVELEQYIDSVTIIDHGKLLYSGSVKNIKTNKSNKFFLKLDDESIVKKLVKFLNKLKISVKVNEDNEVEIHQKNEDDIFKVYEFIAKNKIKNHNIREDVQTLQNVYDEVVVNHKTQLKDGKK